ncbi:YraN family protein [Labrys neptuniae]
MSRPERQAAFRFGLNAETRAAWLLRCKGYRLLAHRFKVPGGEIDLIARRGDTVVFVEVKARAGLAAALEAITPGQRQRIATAARAWLARHPDHALLTQRFDAVFVVPRRWPRHLPNWFEMDLG